MSTTENCDQGLPIIRFAPEGATPTGSARRLRIASWSARRQTRFVFSASLVEAAPDIERHAAHLKHAKRLVPFGRVRYDIWSEDVLLATTLGQSARMRRSR